MTASTTDAGRARDPTNFRARLQISDAARLKDRSAGLPVTRDLRVAHAFSLLVAALIAVVSAAGWVFGYTRLYGVDPKIAAMVTPGIGGLLIPGFQALDLFNLVVGLPILIGSLWLAARGSLTGLLVWPGALFYVLYTYALYLVGAPFNALFLVYVGLVVVSVYTAIGILASVDGELVRHRLAGSVPARTIGGVLIVLAMLTLAQDGRGAVLSTLTGDGSVDPGAHGVWIADLVIEVPSMLIGGVLLWQRQPLGYVAGAGLLLQFGMMPIGLAASLALKGLLSATARDVATIAGLLVFSAVAFVPLVLVVRGAASQPGRPVATPLAGSH